MANIFGSGFRNLLDVGSVLLRENATIKDETLNLKRKLNDSQISAGTTSQSYYNGANKTVLNFMMLNYEVSTNALIKILQKMRPNEDHNKLAKEAIEISKKSLADKYGSDFIDILEEMEKVGLNINEYSAPDSSVPMKQAMAQKSQEIDIETVRRLNEKLSKFLDKAFYDPELDVGLPREEKPRSKMGM